MIKAMHEMITIETLHLVIHKICEENRKNCWSEMHHQIGSETDMGSPTNLTALEILELSSS